jgi:hypothetical protein
MFEQQQAEYMHDLRLAKNFKILSTYWFVGKSQIAEKLLFRL